MEGSIGFSFELESIDHVFSLSVRFEYPWSEPVKSDESVFLRI